MFADLQTSKDRYDFGGTWSEDPNEALSQRADRILALMRSGRRASQRKMTVNKNGDITFSRSAEPKRLSRCIETIRKELDGAYYGQNFETGGLPAFQVPVTLSFGRGIAQRLSFEWEINFEQKLKREAYQSESFDPQYQIAQRGEPGNGSSEGEDNSDDARITGNLPAMGFHSAFASDDFTTGGWTSWAMRDTIVLKTKNQDTNSEPKTNIVVSFEPTDKPKSETSFFTDLPTVPSKSASRIPPAKSVYQAAAFKATTAEKDKDTAQSLQCLKVDTQRLSQMICTVRERRISRLSARAAQLCDERDARGDELAHLSAVETLQRLWIKFETYFWDLQRCSSALLSRSRNSR